MGLFPEPLIRLCPWARQKISCSPDIASMSKLMAQEQPGNTCVALTIYWVI